jgi:hypothetical protein
MEAALVAHLAATVPALAGRVYPQLAPSTTTLGTGFSAFWCTLSLSLVLSLLLLAARAGSVQ